MNRWQGVVKPYPEPHNERKPVVVLRGLTIRPKRVGTKKTKQHQLTDTGNVSENHLTDSHSTKKGQQQNWKKGVNHYWSRPEGQPKKENNFLGLHHMFRKDFEVVYPTEGEDIWRQRRG